MRAELVDPIAHPSWRDFLERSSDATIFHHPSWLRLLRNQYGYHVYGCAVTDGAGTLMAGLPIARVTSRLTGERLVALPFSDLCPPLAADDADETAVPALADALGGERRRTGLNLEIRAELPHAESAFQRHGFYHHVVPLEGGVEAVERRFAKSQVKRGVARARREGLTAERRTDRGALDAFYALHLATRARQGVPTQPKRFIRRFARLFEEGLGFVLMVELEGRPVAAAVFLTFKQTINYKYGASDIQHLSKRPNNLLFMEAIRWACENGFRSLDLGRTDLGNNGLRSFKRSWGATEEGLAYTYLADEPPPGGDLRSRVMATVITHSPARVSRLVGEALYRHFG